MLTIPLAMEFSECKTIKIHCDRKVYYITLNRPHKRNALNRVMITELIDVFTKLANNDNYRAVVLQGNGNYFCSGADLDWMKEGLIQTSEKNKSDALLFETLYNSIHTFPKPIVCSINGGANGGALGIVACSDIVITSNTSIFSLPEVKLGLIPAMVAKYVIKRIGLSHSKRLMLTGDRIDAVEAQQMGLVTIVCENNQLEATTQNTIESLLQNSPQATAQTKLLINNIDTLQTDTATDLIAEARKSNEGQEGVNAFFEKRKPYWHE